MLRNIARPRAVSAGARRIHCSPARAAKPAAGAPPPKNQLQSEQQTQASESNEAQPRRQWGGSALFRNFPRPQVGAQGIYARSHQNLGVHNFTLLAVHHKMKRCWRFVRVLTDGYDRSGLFDKVIAESGISKDEYNQWKDVVMSSDFAAAQEAIERRLAGSSSVLPDWVLLHVFANKTLGRQDATRAADYLRQNVLDNHEIDDETKAGCAILTLHALAKYQLGSLVLPAVDAFIGSEDAPGLLTKADSFYASTLIMAISRFPAGGVLNVRIHQLIRAMQKQGIVLNDEALKHLLASKSNTLEVTRRVLELLKSGSLEERDRIAVEDYITVLQREGALGSVAKILTLLIAPDHVLAAEPEAAAELEASQSQEFPPHFPRGLDRQAFEKMSTFDWITYITQAARDDRGVSSDVLLDLYTFAQQHVEREGTVAVSLRRKLLPTVLSGLVRRGEAARAIKMWEQYLEQDLGADRNYLKLDRHILGAGINALCKADRLLDAFETMDTYGLRVGESRYMGGRSQYDYPSFDPGDSTPRPRVPLSIVTFNTLIQRATISQRPDVVFALWDAMEQTWGTPPDDITLRSVTISSAVAARLRTLHPVREEVQYISFRVRALLMPWKRAAEDGMFGPRGAVNDPANVLRGLLAEPEAGSTLWRGVQPYKRTRHIFRTVLFGNWPELAEIKAPAYALREGDAIDHDLADVNPAAWNATSEDTVIQEEEAPTDLDAAAAAQIQSSASNARVVTPHESSLRYPTIIPDASLFHEYIAMLGQCGCASEIALALAWMRALRLVPESRTLAMALVYWRTVTDDSPAVEIYKESWSKEGEENHLYGSEYVKLVKWLADWVPKSMPSDRELQQYDQYSRRIFAHSNDE